MQNNSIPARVPVPFANSGAKNTIPNNSLIGITAGAASYTDGFPPLTMTPLEAGGIPPSGLDFNGILNAITASIRWGNAGMGYPFDTQFATSVSGYPKGALVPNSDYSGYWFNTVEGNSSSPEVTNGLATGWVPAYNYGVTNITGLSGSSITLTSLQAGKPRIILNGNLTSNINVQFPPFVQRWEILNKCTGGFQIICKTVAGSGVAISAGAVAQISCDGINISNETVNVPVIGVNGKKGDITLTPSDIGVYSKSESDGKYLIKSEGGFIEKPITVRNSTGAMVSLIRGESGGVGGQFVAGHNNDGSRLWWVGSGSNGSRDVSLYSDAWKAGIGIGQNGINVDGNLLERGARVYGPNNPPPVQSQFSANGLFWWHKDASGLITQGMVGAWKLFGDESYDTLTFPIPFPNTCLSVNCGTQTQSESTGGDVWAQVAGWNNFNARVCCQWPGGNSVWNTAIRSIVWATGY